MWDLLMKKAVIEVIVALLHNLLPQRYLFFPLPAGLSTIVTTPTILCLDPWIADSVVTANPGVPINTTFKLMVWYIDLMYFF